MPRQRVHLAGIGAGRVFQPSKKRGAREDTARNDPAGAEHLGSAHGSALGVVGSPPRAGRRARVGDRRRALSLLDRARLSRSAGQHSQASDQPLPAGGVSARQPRRPPDHRVRLCRMRLRLPCGRPGGDAARRRDGLRLGACRRDGCCECADRTRRHRGARRHAKPESRRRARCAREGRRRTRPRPSSQRGTPRGPVGANSSPARRRLDSVSIRTFVAAWRLSASGA